MSGKRNRCKEKFAEKLLDLEQDDYNQLLCMLEIRAAYERNSRHAIILGATKKDFANKLQTRIQMAPQVSFNYTNYIIDIVVVLTFPIHACILGFSPVAQYRL